MAIRKFTLLLLGALASVTAFATEENEEPAVFLTKGTKSASLVFSYDDYNIGNETGFDAFFSLLQGMKASLDTWKFSIGGSYFIKDDFSIGLKIGYNRSTFGVDDASINLSELGLSLANNYYLGHTYTGSISGKYYNSIARSKRFAFFSELRATVAYGQNKTYTIDEGLKHGNYQEKFSAALSVVPGVCIMVMPNVAVELGLEVMGLEWTNTVQTTNQVDASTFNSFGIHYSLDLLSTELGVVLYF